MQKTTGSWHEIVHDASREHYQYGLHDRERDTFVGWYSSREAAERVVALRESPAPEIEGGSVVLRMEGREFVIECCGEEIARCTDANYTECRLLTLNDAEDAAKAADAESLGYLPGVDQPSEFERARIAAQNMARAEAKRRGAKCYSYV